MKNLFFGCPLCTHLSHSHWVEQHFQQLLYSHMIRSLLIEFGQARQDNIWLLSWWFFQSSVTKLSQWIHNTLWRNVIWHFSLYIWLWMYAPKALLLVHICRRLRLCIDSDHLFLGTPTHPPPLHPFFNSVV